VTLTEIGYYACLVFSSKNLNYLAFHLQFVYYPLCNAIHIIHYKQHCYNTFYFTVILITIICTVNITVTFPALWYTFTIPTCKWWKTTLTYNKQIEWTWICLIVCLLRKYFLLFVSNHFSWCLQNILFHGFLNLWF